MMTGRILRGDLDSWFVPWFLGANWVVTLLAGAGALYLSTPRMAGGILAGAAIANLNCAGLNRDCRRVVRWRTTAAYYGGLAVRLALIALGVTSALLVFPHMISPVGLFLGLSVAVANFYVLVLAMVIYRVRIKEAV